MRSSLRKASVVSLTVRPKASLGAVLSRGSLPAARRGFSGSNSPTVTTTSRVLPRRSTCSVAREPGLVAPIKRGRSPDFSTVLPSTFKMMSPASTPALSAGLPDSTPCTRAPEGLPRPSDSATSLLTGPMPTPMRPRITRPAVRSWSATRMASSMGMANEMPMNPPERL